MICETVHNSPHTVFADPKTQRKQIMRITTDSRPMEEPKDPESDHLYQLYHLLATEEQAREMADMYRRGGFGYGDVKKAIAEAADVFFAQSRARRAELEHDRARVHSILADGASRARRKAADVLLRAQRACGIKY